MDKRENSAGRIADHSGSHHAPPPLGRLSQKRSRTIAFSNVPRPFGRADRGGENLLLDILCGILSRYHCDEAKFWRLAFCRATCLVMGGNLSVVIPCLLASRISHPLKFGPSMKPVQPFPSESRAMSNRNGTSSALAA